MNCTLSDADNKSSPTSAGDSETVPCGSSPHLVTPLLIATMVVATDQLSKLATSSSDCGDLICPLPNEALFLGIGQGSNVSAVATGLVGLALFGAWVRRARRRGVVSPVAVAIIIAGIVANTIDRVRLGFVRDFLSFPGGLVINVADVAVVGGLLVCVASVGRSLLHSQSIQERR